MTSFPPLPNDPEITRFCEAVTGSGHTIAEIVHGADTTYGILTGINFICSDGSRWRIHVEPLANPPVELIVEEMTG